MTVIGIDPSLTGTGISTPDGQTTVRSEPTPATIESRWLRLTDLVDRIAAHVPYEALVVIEAPSLGQARQGGTLDRNGLWWLLVHHLLDHHASVIEVTPATLKKFATGKGNATKPDMRMTLYQRAGIDCRDDNKVDAWWLRQIGLHLTEHLDRIDMPKVNLTALDKINR